MRTFLFVFALTCVSWLQAQQIDMRVEDHFWRRRVVKRIDFNEKINQPLVHHDDQVYYGKQRFKERQGIVQALIHGVEENKFKVYDPDNNRELDSAGLVRKMLKLNNAWQKYDKKLSQGKLVANAFDEALAEEESDDLFAKSENDEFQMDYTPYEQIFHVVEDWTFDKVQSRMIQNIDFFQIIWSDPQGLLPDRVVANIRYKDVEDILATTQWKTRHNDSEARSAKEIFDLKLYNAIFVNVAGYDVHTLAEAQKRLQEIIEFESNLWQN